MWEKEEPIKVEVTIDHHCHPPERQTSMIGDPFNQVAIAMQAAGTRPYQIHQALTSVATFWGQVASGDRDPSEFDQRFDRIDRKKKRGG